MATLEKIRSKSVMLFILIIVALLAFILGDFLTSGRTFSGNTTTMLKAGSTKVDYNDYQKRMNLVQQNQRQKGADSDEMMQEVLDQLLFEQLLNEEMDKLGINITDEQISDAMLNQPYGPASQFLRAAAQYMQLPSADGAMVLDAINNPGRYNLNQGILDQIAQQAFNSPSMQAAWAQQEQAIEESLRQQAFGQLYSGLFTANALDAQQMYNDNMTKNIVSYVAAPLNTIPDDQVEVADADIKAKWQELQSSYQLNDETRTVDYVVVDIKPSRADLDAAEVEVDAAVEALAALPGVEGIMGKAHFINENVNVPKSKVKQHADLRTLPDSVLAAGKVHKFRLNRATNTFTVAKVLDVKPQIDSVNISMFASPDAAQIDSVVNALANAKTFDAVAETMPEQVRDSMWIPMMQMPQNFRDTFEAAAIGQPFAYTDSIQGISGAFIVNKRNAPVEYAEVAVIKYTVDPSNATVTDLKTKLNSFVASNSKGDMFSANADSLYTLRHASVTSRTPHIGDLADSRSAVKWAMNAKPGQVSKVFETRDYYLVVALKDVYNDYLPYTNSTVNEQLANMVKADKKAQKLIEQYAGKANNLEEYATLMNGTVRVDSAIVFTSPRVGTIGYNEYALQGTIAGAPESQIVGPVKGNNQVIVFVVNGRDSEGRPFNQTQDGSTFMNTFAVKDIPAMLIGNRKVKDYSLQFSGRDE